MDTMNSRDVRHPRCSRCLLHGPPPQPAQPGRLVAVPLLSGVRDSSIAHSSVSSSTDDSRSSRSGGSRGPVIVEVR